MLGEDMRGDDLRSATGHNTGNTFNNSIRSNTTSVRDINTSGGRAIVANQFNGDVTINETGETEEQRQDRKRQKVIASLEFTERGSRYERIPHAYQDTFQWVFDGPEARDIRYNSLVDWLRRDDSTIYWIQGKAGSGKSTLLKFIGEHSLTLSHLKVWAQGKRVVLPHHFFWRAGSEQQKNTVGLLRTVLCQILTEFPFLVDNLPGFHGKRVQSWTYERLANALTHTLAHEGLRFCLFIDGIDEFDDHEGSVEDLVELLQRLSQLRNVKICLSSRPELFLKDSFGQFEGLRLQDLTAGDIKTTVRGKLMATERFRKYDRQDPQWASAFVDTVCEKADGIFLWIHLAVADLLNGLRKHDTMRLLEQRLGHLSRSLHSLFASFLQRLEPVYKKTAANLLRIRLLNYDSLTPFLRAPNVLEYAAAFDALAITSNGSEYGLLSIADENISRLAESLSELSQSIPEHSAGLLELRTIRPGIPATNKLADIITYYTYACFDFIHRSVYDFFREDEDAKLFVDTVASPEIETLDFWLRFLLHRTWMPFAGLAHNAAVLHFMPNTDQVQMDDFDRKLTDFLSALIEAFKPISSRANANAVYSQIQPLLRLMEANYSIATPSSGHDDGFNAFWPHEAEVTWFLRIWHKLAKENESLKQPGAARSIFISAVGSYPHYSAGSVDGILADLILGQLCAGIALKDCVLHAYEHVDTEHADVQNGQIHRNLLLSSVSEWRFLHELLRSVSNMPPADEELAVRQIIAYIEHDTLLDGDDPVAEGRAKDAHVLHIYLSPLAYVKRLWTVEPKYLDLAVSALERLGAPDRLDIIAKPESRDKKGVVKSSSPIHQGFAERALELMRAERSGKFPPETAFPEQKALNDFIADNSAELGITSFVDLDRGLYGEKHLRRLRS